MTVRKMIRAAGCICLMAALAFVCSGLFGISKYVVVSASMSPSIPVGACIFVRHVSFEELQEGQVITYLSDHTSMPVTHRIVEIDKAARTVRTKGDANRQPDGGTVSAGQIQGQVVWQLPLVGYLLWFLHTAAGKTCLLAAAAAAAAGRGLVKYAVSNHRKELK